MTPGRKHQQCGSSALEFTLVGIPILFLLISTFEISRGMWTYHTTAFAVKEGTRYASVHGHNCSAVPNTCTITVAQITQRILDSGVALVKDQLTLTFIANGTSITCLAANCLSNTTVWPAPPGDAVGSNIEIDGTYPFQSAILMLWPGGGPGINFGAVNFPASSRETVQF